MGITNAPRPRQVAAWASLACLALLLTACSAGPPKGPTPHGAETAGGHGPGTASTPGGRATSPGTPATTAGGAAAPTGANTFLAVGQDIKGPLLHEPACRGYGCALSGDSTTFLANMKWTTWSGTKAVGTGTYKINDCNPNCAAGHVYSVATVVTLSHPVKVCSASGTRWVWSHASFLFPHGLPAALHGQNAPQNPWSFSPLVTAAQQSCAT
jgi:hypothetical protein